MFGSGRPSGVGGECLQLCGGLGSEQGPVCMVGCCAQKNCISRYVLILFVCDGVILMWLPLDLRVSLNCCGTTIMDDNLRLRFRISVIL